ncbi:sodium/calcium exchanger NCL2-like isoform X2 [Rhododendron vialii]|uniref:sodium/calcium exchanger NCL2-like isoform X2 n=1 Tax=Rhododendron vialii TaxID=182163 RepID=UPI00265F8F79|nr:sodium/calcium exchanger NCL2-like isoform X2 [Rhododendron vialii]
MANLVLCLAFLFLAFGEVQCRFLRLNSSVLVSDGVANVDHRSSILSLNGLLSSSADVCEHYYGFFPCADNIGGFLFQIVVYEYLLATGEKFLTKGSKQLFNIIGTGFFGDVFEILMVLPEMMVVLTGLTENEEDAQSGVSVSVGVYAGSTVFCLTLQWGICVIFGRNSFKPESSTSQDSEHSTSRTSLMKEKLSLLTDSGVTTDNKTGYTAGIMLLSLIPFFIVQLSGIINTSSGSRIVVLIALIVSVSGLLAYFMYQILNPWIQERSLEYMKYENLLAGFLNHVQRHTQGRLVTNEGAPNVPVIRSLFAKVDRDGDQTVSISEVEALIEDLKSGKVDVEKEYAIAEVLKTFDLNKDGTITEGEFVEGFKKWIHEAKHLAEDGSSHSRKSLRQVVQPWIEKRKHELVKIERLMSRILKHVQNQAFEADGLVTDDGRPNVDRIKSLFEEYDSNHNKLISQSELKEVIQNIRFGKFPLDHDLVAENVMKDFDEDGDQMISEQEFVNGFTKWIHKATHIANSKDSKNFIDEFDKIAWKEVDSLMYEKEENRGIIHKLLSRDCIKSVLQIILGAAIVSFLAEPLIYSILDLSTALGLSTFYISFVIIPFALKFKMAVSAIFPASQKSLKTASLTFSEIYGGVVMNNITGLSILLAIVYIKGLTWDYSVEVLVVLVVCAIIGLLAFFRSSYPLWTCILAFFLYPFSLLLVHFLHNSVGWD